MFSATDAAFSGFRAARENPRMVLVWAVFLAVVSTLLTAIMIVMAGPALVEMQQKSGQPTTDPTESLRLFGALAPMFLTLMPVSLIYNGVLYAAANRLVLRPADNARAYLGFGPDEFRQIGLIILSFLLFFGVYLGFGLVAAILGALAMLVSPIVGGFVLVLALMSVAAVLISLVVKISLASADTFTRGKVSLFGTWNLTKGHFWPMLGAYLLAVIMAAIVNLLAFGVFVGFVVLPLGGLEGVGAFMQADPTSLETYFTLPRLIYIPVAGVISALTWLIVLCPAPTIYRQLKAGGAA